MDIEIITTKKKLTLSILKQMSDLSYFQFKSSVVEVLGYVTVELKHTNKNALCRWMDDYYLLNMKWERRGSYAGYNRSGHRGEYTKPLSPEIIDDWFEQYNRIVNEANQKGHIYV